jgi:rhamnosyltransferase
MTNFNQFDDVAGIVVLYEPTNDILHNIQSYITQVRQLFVVDNSENPDELIIEKIKKINSAEYIGLKENIGIASALNIGAERAIKGGFSYLLTMDQDSLASPQLVIKLLDVFSYHSMVGISSAFPVNKMYPKLPPDDNIHKIDSVITSGNLVNLRAYNHVGPFLNKLFIDYVDFEFCFRMKREGYNIYINNAATISHSVGELKKWRLFGISYYSTNHSPLRLYYRTRNRFYVRNIYHKEFTTFFMHDLWLFIKEIIKIIMVESTKFAKLKMIIRGYIDYQKNIFGKSTDG